ELSRNPRRFGGTEIRRLEDGPQHALCRDWMRSDVVRVACEHATKILRPWAVYGTVDDDVADLPSAQTLGRWRKPRNASIFPCTNNSMGLTLGSAIQWMSFAGSSPTWAAIRVTSCCESDPSICTPILLPFSSAMLPMPVLAKSSKQPTI